MSKTQYAVLIIVLAIIAAYGVFLYTSKPSLQTSSQSPQNEKTESPVETKEPMRPSSSETPKAPAPVAITVEKVERDIKEVLALKDVSGGDAEAEAVLAVQNGKLTLSLRADKLPDPGSSRYAGWLYKDGSSVPMYIGPLSKISSGEFKDSYVLGFQGGSELQTYKIVVVTKEAILDDFVPEKRILEGRFK